MRERKREREKRSESEREALWPLWALSRDEVCVVVARGVVVDEGAGIAARTARGLDVQREAVLRVLEVPPCAPHTCVWRGSWKKGSRFWCRRGRGGRARETRLVVGERAQRRDLGLRPAPETIEYLEFRVCRSFHSSISNSSFLRFPITGHDEECCGKDHRDRARTFELYRSSSSRHRSRPS